MIRYKYRVYLQGRTFDTVFECATASEGEAALKAQYGCNVAWLGRA
jgi:hypothetical protein